MLVTMLYSATLVPFLFPEGETSEDWYIQLIAKYLNERRESDVAVDGAVFPVFVVAMTEAAGGRQAQVV